MNLPRIVAVFGLPILVAATPDQVPDLDLNKTCASRGVASDATQACLRDERAAKSQLEKGWASIARPVRERCIGEISIGGSPSYVELLTCAQMEKWSRQPTTTAPASR